MIPVDMLVSMQIDSLKCILATIFYVTNVIDYYTTKKALEAGFREGNPFAARIMRSGWRKYQAAKMLGPLVFTAYGLASEDPFYIWRVCFIVGAGAFLTASIQNMMLMAGRKIAKKGGD